MPVCVCVHVCVHVCACVCVCACSVQHPITTDQRMPTQMAKSCSFPASFHKKSIMLINTSFCWLLFFVCVSSRTGETKWQPVHLTDFGFGIHWTWLVKYWNLPVNTNPESTQFCLRNIPEVGLIRKATKEPLGRSHFESSSHSCFRASGLYYHCPQPPQISKQHWCWALQHHTVFPLTLTHGVWPCILWQLSQGRRVLIGSRCVSLGVQRVLRRGQGAARTLRIHRHRLGWSVRSPLSREHQDQSVMTWLTKSNYFLMHGTAGTNVILHNEIACMGRMSSWDKCDSKQWEPAWDSWDKHDSTQWNSLHGKNVQLGQMWFQTMRACMGQLGQTWFYTMK